MLLRILLTFFSLCILHPLIAEDSGSIAIPPRLMNSKQLIANELSILDNLIASTQRSLEKQKELRELIVKYQDAQRACLKNSNDEALLYAMVKAAHRTLEAIKENHLMDNFDPEFLSELNLLSQIAVKCGIPKA